MERAESPSLAKEFVLRRDLRQVSSSLTKEGPAENHLDFRRTGVSEPVEDPRTLQRDLNKLPHRFRATIVFALYILLLFSLRIIALGVGESGNPASP